jgi:hypothetical protein
VIRATPTTKLASPLLWSLAGSSTGRAIFGFGPLFLAAGLGLAVGAASGIIYKIILSSE